MTTMRTEKEAPSKVLFLDIDGVLNSHRTAIAFGGMPFRVHRDRAMFDEVAIRLIAGIVKAAGAGIVLSSSWRLSDSRWADIGPALGLPIFDRTPSMLGPRGREIGAWLEAHPEVDTYAIVDDDPDMLPDQLPFFVQTDMHDGLTWTKAVRLADLLGVRIFDVNRGARMPVPAATALQWDDAPAEAHR